MDGKVDKPTHLSSEVRSLRGPAEVEAWLDFVASCFAFKGTPREHFSSHFYLDPWKDHKAVFVAEEKRREGGNAGEEQNSDRPTKLPRKDESTLRTTCMSTLRCFCRQIYVGGQARKCAGIGEVCTREDRRRMGLSNLVLSHAGNSMHREGYSLASLHSSQMSVVYQKAGFQTVPLTYTCHTFTSRPNPIADGCSTEPANMKDENLIGSLMPLHASFNRKFDGPMVRDHEEYWSGYMHSNMQDSGYVLKRQGREEEAEELLVAFASLKANKSKPGSFLVADFFCSEQEIERDGGLQALQLLVSAALEGRGLEQAEVQLPLAVTKKMDFTTAGHSLEASEQAKQEEESKPEEDAEGKEHAEEGKEEGSGREERVVDLGFMYKRLAPEGEAAYPSPEQHVFWPVDGY